MAAESVKVVVSCPPMNDRAQMLNCKTVVSVEMSRCQCFIKKPGAKEEPPKQFTFDGSLFIDQNTEQMYNEIIYPLVEVSQTQASCQVTSVQTGSEGEENADSPPIGTPGPLDQKHVLKRLQHTGRGIPWQIRGRSS
ncbi:kinesin-like protein KIF17 isoform X2 [Salvelinus sp. IW2-2015]|uniref:kinesin-like protein KIF17 isoform X2 n=1 Tax=Salvelinus sp. IW2-2015 TaxID=2691554 RepID=UPI0038D4099A